MIMYYHWNTKTKSTEKFNFSFKGLQSNESFLNLELPIAEQSANKKNSRKRLGRDQGSCNWQGGIFSFIGKSLSDSLFQIQK